MSTRTQSHNRFWVLSKCASIGAFLLGGVISLNAQNAQDPSGFEGSEQIVQTNILFAIGAREAEQQLRGSFGWPTFQEGFVDGVYFRFDPDGYARFSPSARLDEDVFEVICANGITSCIATKGSLQLGLTPTGPVQIRIEGITPSDTFFITDRKTELPVPNSVLGPLDARLETLLGSGGELLVKREVEVIQNISLTGFNAVATYLRWVAQSQNARVFPRGWPVPASNPDIGNAGLTQPNQWDTPSAGPQTVNWNAQPQQRRIQQNQQFNSQNQAGQWQSNPQFSGVSQPQLNGGFQAQIAPNSTQNEELIRLRETVSKLQGNIEILANQGGGNQTQGFVQQPQQGQFPVADSLQQNGQVGQQQVFELGQSFAQQAQGRALNVTSTAFNGVAGGEISRVDQNALVNNPTIFPQNGTALTQQSQINQAYSEPSQSDRNLEHIRKLENNMQVLRSEMNSQLASIMAALEHLSSIQTGTTETNFSTPMGANGVPQSHHSSMDVSPTQNAIQPAPRLVEQPQQNASLSEIEQLLLNRLNQQNGVPGIVVSGTSTVDQVAPTVQTSIADNLASELSGSNVNKQLVEEILNELNKTELAENPSIESDASPKSEDQTEQSESANGGFVTLSDYLNQVMKKEGLSEGAQN